MRIKGVGVGGKKNWEKFFYGRDFMFMGRDIR
jgi:hypothetical protein